MSDLLSQVKNICRLMEIRPRRSKGQNFLISEKIYNDIIQAADLQALDTVLEIGPGLGFLTIKLAEKVSRVVAVEIDEQLSNYLKMGLDSRDTNNVQIINEDILHFNPEDYGLFSKKYKIVANLPYNITSIFLRSFLSSSIRPQSLVLMLQKEVADRIVAQAPKMSILAISVQYYARAEIIRIVKADNFWPKPQVDSALIKLTLRNREYSQAEDKIFFRLIKIGFSSKRKMLKNNLASGLKVDVKIISQLLVKQGFNPQIRAEGLSVSDWQGLFVDLRPFVV